MMSLNNNILTTTNGKIIKPFSIPPIELQNEGIYFPNYFGTSNNFSLSFTSSVPNIIYFDFGDGSPIHSIEFTNTISIYNSIKTYTDGVNIHIIKIWFKLPSKLTAIYWLRIISRGKFPEAIGYYNLDSLSIQNSYYFQDFNTDFPPVYQRRIRLNNVTNNTVVGIPEWILKSRIESVDLGTKFDLSNPLTNRVDRLIEVKDLKYFAIIENNGLTNIAPNFKDITTLRGLSFSNSYITSITPEINACKQLTHLIWGYSAQLEFGTTSTYSRLRSWGSGLYGMVNLVYFGIGSDEESNMPTTLPDGIEDCINIKSLYFAGSFIVQTRLDAFIRDIYSKIPSIASKSPGNTKFRQITLHIGFIYIRVSIPSGTYQAPSGFVLGSSNGTPESPMEMLYVLKKQYAWNIIIQNANGTGNQTLP